MEKKTDYRFFEIYKSDDKHGFGTFLVYRSTKKCEYVMFQSIDNTKKIVFNKPLLDLYNKTA